MEHEAWPLETESQWEEHSDGWRWAHLDWAPSAYHRRRAMEDRELHERLALGQANTAVVQDHGHRAGLPHLALEMMAVLAIAAAIVIGAALR